MMILQLRRRLVCTASAGWAQPIEIPLSLPNGLHAPVAPSARAAPPECSEFATDSNSKYPSGPNAARIGESEARNCLQTYPNKSLMKLLATNGSGNQRI